MTVHDIEIADTIATAAFRASSSRREELELYRSLQPDGWLIASCDGQPAGIGGVVTFGPFATLGMMAVHPARQRRGIARALLDRLTAWLDRRRVPLTVLDASDMGAPLYPQYGFEDRGHTLQYRLAPSGTQGTPSYPQHEFEDRAQYRLTSHDTPSATQETEEQSTAEDGAAFVVSPNMVPDRAGNAGPPVSIAMVPDRALSGVFPITVDMVSLVAVLDGPIFGADRAAVLRSYFSRYEGRVFASVPTRSRNVETVFASPAAPARNERGAPASPDISSQDELLVAASAGIRLRDEEHRFASAESRAQMDGYIVARSAQLGPWVARRPASAELLLRAALNLPFTRAPIVNVPAENVDALTLLERYGFTRDRSLRHMVRGAGTPPDRRDLIYGQASFAIG